EISSVPSPTRQQRLALLECRATNCRPLFKGEPPHSARADSGTTKTSEVSETSEVSFGEFAAEKPAQERAEKTTNSRFSIAIIGSKKCDGRGKDSGGANPH